MSYISFQPKDYFNTVLYTGTGSTQNITGVGFQPDWVWNKARNATEDHSTIDAVRGVTKSIYPSDAAAEQTLSTGLTAFGSDGYTVGGDGYWGYNGRTYASWNWKAGGGQGSSNTDGSINTTYTSVSTVSGFSISSYTGTGANATIGTGLGQIPSVVLVKSRSNGEHWCMYHSSLGNASRLLLNLTNAQETSRSEWQSTTPTSSVFSVDGSDQVNGSGSKTYVAYCFAEKTGFSKFGSYTGNANADGPFVYTGFKPALIIRKRTDATEDWAILDNKRLGYNPDNSYLFPNGNNAESAIQRIDFLSNGFKLRTTDGGDNASGATYVYMAWSAEALVSSNGVPATAR